MRQGILLDGYYGQSNTGDDAFCQVGAVEYRQRLGRPVSIRAAARSLPLLDTDFHPALSGRRMVRGQKRVESLAAAIWNRDVVHLGGSRFVKPNDALADQLRARRTAGLHLHAQSVSIGPFADDRERDRSARILSAFATISVRDGASLQRAVQIGLRDVTRSADVAVLVPRMWSTETGKGDGALEAAVPVLGVALRGQSAYAGEPAAQIDEREQRVSTLIARVLAASPSVRIRLLCMSQQDEPLAQGLRAGCGSQDRIQVVPYHRDTRLMYRAVATCTVVLAMRLHAAIFAYAAQRPFSLIAYHGKCIDFADDVGLDQRLRCTIEGPTPALQDRLIDRLTGSDAPTWALSLPLESAQASALHGFDVVTAHLRAH